MISCPSKDDSDDTEQVDSDDTDLVWPMLDIAVRLGVRMGA